MKGGHSSVRSRGGGGSARDTGLVRGGRRWGCLWLLHMSCPSLQWEAVGGSANIAFHLRGRDIVDSHGWSRHTQHNINLLHDRTYIRNITQA